MAATILNERSTGIIGASLFAPSSTAWDLYEVVLDVRNFPRWAPGVRRVEVVEGSPGPGMISEWEISFLGLKRKISSVLEEAEPPALLSWTYEGLVRGWGRCIIKEQGDGALAEFHTELRPAEPLLEKLMSTPYARNAASSHLKRCLARLGGVVCGEDAPVRVGPLEGNVRGRGVVGSSLALMLPTNGSAPGWR